MLQPSICVLCTTFQTLKLYVQIHTYSVRLKIIQLRHMVNLPSGRCRCSETQCRATMNSVQITSMWVAANAASGCQPEYWHTCRYRQLYILPSQPACSKTQAQLGQQSVLWNWVSDTYTSIYVLAD